MFRIPVVATGVFQFLERILFVEADEYFRRYQTDPQNFHFVLLDEVRFCTFVFLYRIFLLYSTIYCTV